MLKLCRLKEILEGQSKGFVVPAHQGTINVVIIKKRGHIYAYINNCPHANTPLNWQPDQFLDQDLEFIQCSNHGARFDIETGECVSGPCIGESLTSVKNHAKDQFLYIDI